VEVLITIHQHPALSGVNVIVVTRQITEVVGKGNGSISPDIGETRSIVQILLKLNPICHFSVRAFIPFTPNYHSGLRD